MAVETGLAERRGLPDLRDEKGRNWLHRAEIDPVAEGETPFLSAPAVRELGSQLAKGR